MRVLKGRRESKRHSELVTGNLFGKVRMRAAVCSPARVSGSARSESPLGPPALPGPR